MKRKPFSRVLAGALAHGAVSVCVVILLCGWNPFVGNEGQHNEVEAILSKNTVYPQEQTLLTYRLYTRVDLRYEGFDREPQLPWQWYSDKPVKDLTVKPEVIKRLDMKMVAADVRSIALYPIKSGDYEILPGIVNVSYLERGMRERKEDKLHVPPRRLTVMPFPESGKPVDFNGFTGRFEMKSGVEVRSKDDGDYGVFRIEISGEGNLEQFPMPAYELPQGVTVSKTDAKADITWDSGGPSGSKVFETLLRVSAPGEVVLPAAHFSYFDPQERSYVSVKGEEQRFTIHKVPPEKKAEALIDAGKSKIVVCLDVSGSMLALDFKPKGRLEVAKEALEQLLTSDEMKHKLSLIQIFAKVAEVKKPFELPLQEIAGVLEKIEVGSLQDGTAIGRAVYEAIQSIRDTGSTEKASILVVTDGASNAPYLDTWTAAEMAAELGIRIDSILIGRGGKVPFPIKDEDFGDRIIEADVKIDPSAMQEMSERTGGKFFHVGSLADFDAAVAQLKQDLA